MTGQCYYCAMGEHHECYSESCTCCGERNRKHNQDAKELAILIRQRLQRGDLWIASESID